MLSGKFVFLTTCRLCSTHDKRRRFCDSHFARPAMNPSSYELIDLTPSPKLSVEANNSLHPHFDFAPLGQNFLPPEFNGQRTSPTSSLNDNHSLLLESNSTQPLSQHVTSDSDPNVPTMDSRLKRLQSSWRSMPWKTEVFLLVRLFLYFPHHNHSLESPR
jgi:hypothetical protein